MPEPSKNVKVDNPSWLKSKLVGASGVLPGVGPGLMSRMVGNKNDNHSSVAKESLKGAGVGALGGTAAGSLVNINVLKHPQIPGKLKAAILAGSAIGGGMVGSAFRATKAFAKEDTKVTRPMKKSAGLEKAAIQANKFFKMMAEDVAAHTGKRDGFLDKLNKAYSSNSSRISDKNWEGSEHLTQAMKRWSKGRKSAKSAGTTAPKSYKPEHILQSKGAKSEPNYSGGFRGGSNYRDPMQGFQSRTSSNTNNATDMAMVGGLGALSGAGAVSAVTSMRDNVAEGRVQSINEFKKKEKRKAKMSSPMSKAASLVLRY